MQQSLWSQHILQQLNQQQIAQRYRKRIPTINGNQRQLLVDNRTYLNFASNDYLGLSTHPNIIQVWQQGAAEYGLGSGGSGHITGYSLLQQQFEAQLADWLGYPRALLFSSGFAANQAVIYSLADNTATIIADKLSHASIQEAAHLATKHYFRFKHNDMADLQRIYQKVDSNKPTLLISEGVFSMDGDEAPMSQLKEIAQQQQALFMLDDAHGVGVLGLQGRGSSSHQQIKPDILLVTFGKAFGLQGAAILCCNEIAELLLQKARHLIYSTNMPLAQIAALQQALIEIQQGDDLRLQLKQNIAQFKRLANAAGLPLTVSMTAIQPLIIGDNQQALELANQLKNEGIWLTAIRPPTVPQGQARLRITLSAFHQAEDIEHLVSCLAKFWVIQHD